MDNLILRYINLGLTDESIAEVLSELNLFKPVDVEEEYDEIFRASHELDVNFEKLIHEIEHAKPVKLTDDIWSILENTDSWDTTSREQVNELALLYGRDADSIRKAFKEGLALPTPMIAKKDGRYVLIGGNTRLMVAREMGIQPEVIIVNI